MRWLTPFWIVIFPGLAWAGGKAVEVDVPLSDVTHASVSADVGAGPIYDGEGLRGYGLRGSFQIPLVLEEIGRRGSYGHGTWKGDWDSKGRFNESREVILFEPGIKGRLEWGPDKKFKSHSVEVSVGSVLNHFMEKFDKKVTRLTDEMSKLGVTRGDIVELEKSYDLWKRTRESLSELDESYLQRSLKEVQRNYEQTIENQAKVNPVFKRIRDARNQYRDEMGSDALHELDELKRDQEAATDQFLREMETAEAQCQKMTEATVLEACKLSLAQKQKSFNSKIEQYRSQKKIILLKKTEKEGERDDVLRKKIPEYDRFLKERQAAFEHAEASFRKRRAKLKKLAKIRLKSFLKNYSKFSEKKDPVTAEEIETLLAYPGNVSGRAAAALEQAPFYSHRLDVVKLSYVNRKGDILPGAGQHGARVEGLSFQVRTGVEPGGIPMNVCALVSPAGLLLGQQKLSAGHSRGVAYQGKLGGCFRAQVGKVGTLSEDLSGEFTMPLSSDLVYEGSGKSRFVGDIRLTNRLGVKNILGTPLEVGYETQWEHEWDQGKKNSATTHMLTVGAGIE